MRHAAGGQPRCPPRSFSRLARRARLILAFARNGRSKDRDRRMSVATARERGALLEREESLAILGALLDGVRSGGEGRLALVGGEAGVGKTALTHRFCEACRLPVLWGSCEPL